MMIKIIFGYAVSFTALAIATLMFTEDIKNPEIKISNENLKNNTYFGKKQKGIFSNKKTKTIAILIAMLVVELIIFHYIT